MIYTDEIFRYKTPNSEKLIANGFSYSNGTYQKSVPIMKKQFLLKISVTDSGSVDFKVYDAAGGDEYVLVHVPEAEGAFVAEVRAACEKALVQAAEKCFDTQRLKAEQTKRIIEYIKSDYGAEPEFLWEAYPNYAVFRIKENEKWFAAIMTIDRSKLGLPGHGNIELIDLKDTPEHVAQRVDGRTYFSGYHMNKKHWYTVCLDGSVTDEEIRALIGVSYMLTAKIK